jgi:hypothetical protein
MIATVTKISTNVKPACLCVRIPFLVFMDLILHKKTVEGKRGSVFRANVRREGGSKRVV